MMQKFTLVVEHIAPPIPTTRWDWVVYVEETMQDGHARHSGWGADADAAMRDLVDTYSLTEILK
jgi:hypothetical protein